MEGDFCSRETLSRPEHTANRIRGYNSVAALRHTPSRGGAAIFRDFCGNGLTTCALMKIVVAYSGGLDTSVILHWLKETYRCEIVAYCADIGQEEELKGLDKKAQGHRREQVLRARPRRGIRARFHFPDDPGGRDLREPVFPRHQHRAAADRQGAGRHRAQGKRRHRGARRDGEGQRPVPVRVDLCGARAGPENHRAVAVAGVPQPIQGPGRDARVLRREGHQGRGQREEAVLDGPQSPAHLVSRAASSKTRGPSRRRTCSSSASSPEDAPNKPEYVELDFESGNCVAVERQEAVARQRPAHAQQARRQTRHWPGRSRREPVRRHEIAGRVRNARRRRSCISPIDRSRR